MRLLCQLQPILEHENCKILFSFLISKNLLSPLTPPLGVPNSIRKNDMTALYIASNTNSLGSQVQLQRSISVLGDVLTRLSTGLRINSAKDDPSGLIASELLKSDIIGTKQAIQNTQRGSSVIAIADSALGQVSSLLTDIRTLVNASANEIGLSVDQLAANQLQVDATIDSIDRISRTTNFQGLKLLDGSMAYQANGISTEKISGVDVQSANFGADSAPIQVEVDLLAAAQKAALIYYGTQVDERTTMSVSGKTGSEVFSFGKGTSIKQMADAINRMSDSTGVAATVEGIPARGTITLSSVGANNDIIVTSNTEGFDAGNYSFRIVKGATNDAYIVSDPTADRQGVIEISLKQSYSKTYEKFADAFDITLETDSETSRTSVSMTSGTENSAVYHSEAQNAVATTKNATVQVVNAGKDGHISNLNGWTFRMVDASHEWADKLDFGTKTAYVVDPGDSLNMAVAKISGATIDHDQTSVHEEVEKSGVSTLITGTLNTGDSFKFSGGAEKGELVITYKEGATLGQIQELINSNTGAQATLAKGMHADDLVANVPSTASRVIGTTALVSNTTSSVTASELVSLLNMKFTDLFTATLARDDTGAGNITYMNAAVDYGVVDTENPELGSALRFTGLASGPVVRIVESGQNQELSVTLRNPTQADLDAGITTKVLQIQLATDSSGRSITTAQEIVDFFNTLRPDQTGGVSASLLLPPGVDPNGRTWDVDECGKEIVTEDCNSRLGQGIVRGTGETGPCGVEENDLLLLGSNQKLVETNAVAYVPNSTLNAGAGTTDKPWASFVDNNGMLWYLESSADTSLLNGITFRLQTDTQGVITSAAQAATVDAVSFDESTGVITVLMYDDGNTSSNGQSVLTAVTRKLSDEGFRTRLAAYNGSGESNAVILAESEIIGILTSARDLDGVEFQFNAGIGHEDIFDAQASTGYVPLLSNDFIWLSTKSATSSLNGVSINFTSDPAKSGFNENNGALTVYLPQELFLISASEMEDYYANIATFNEILNQTINGVIHSHWEQIRQYTGSTEDPAQVTSLVINNNHLKPNLLDSNLSAELLLQMLPETSTELKFSTISADDTVNSNILAMRGTSVNDAALIIESKVTGPDMSGIRIVFQQDDSLQQSSNEEAYIRTDFTTASDGTRILTVYANASAVQNGTTGGIDAAVLAAALNRDESFASMFTATAPIVNNDSTKTTTTATVAFGSGTLSSTQTVGGWNIETTNTGQSQKSTSAGISMFGNQDDNQHLVIHSTDYGSDSFVKILVAEGIFETYAVHGNEELGSSYTTGSDARVNVNGQLAASDGQNVSVSNTNLQLSFTIRDAMEEGDTTYFYISGGGVIVQAGGDVVSTQQVRLGIPEVNSATLGGNSGKLYQLRTGGDAELKTNTVLADKIIQEAIQSVALIRGRLGSIQKNTLESNQAVLEDSVEQLSHAEAIISNADFAEESSRLTRTQILVQSGTQVLTIANQLPQYAAQLIG